MIRVYADRTCLIVLGRLGENDHTCVVFDKSVQELLAQYPNATIGLYNRPARRDQSYPVAATQRVGDTLEWTVQSAELAEEGRGQCELVAVDNGTIAKSIIYNTSVSPALTGSGTAPSPWEEWMAEFIRLKGEAEAAAEDAEEAASHYPVIFNGTWWLWDAEGGVYVNTGIEAMGPQGVQGVTFTPNVSDAGVISWTNDGGLPNPTERNIKGGKGDDGVSPTITVAIITGGHRITITDADHPQGQSVDVMDGSNGRGIVSVEKTGTSGLVDTYTITYTSGGPTTFLVTNGADGDPGTPGTSAYVWIRYAQQQPTQDSDMSSTPGPWMGVYSGSSATAPEHYTDYVWYEIKGATGPVQDVQVNGVSVLGAQGVANVPVATRPLLPYNPGAFGVMRIGNLGVTTYNDTLCLDTPTDEMLKQGTTRDRAVTVFCQEKAAFYGLAKAAGDTTQSASSNAVGTYTDSAIDKILAMLGVDALIGTHETSATASEAKSIGDVFIFAGKLYKATAAIASGAAIVPGTNCEQTNLINLIRGT